MLIAGYGPMGCGIARSCARGDLGVKTGKGHYDWTGRDADTLKARGAGKLRRILAIVQEP